MPGTNCFFNRSWACNHHCKAFEQVGDDPNKGECNILLALGKLTNSIAAISRVMVTQEADRVRNSGPRPPVVR